MAVRNITVVDTDSHVFESQEIWEKYLDTDYRVPARSAFSYKERDGVFSVIVNGKPAPAPFKNKINRWAIWKPGMTAEQIGSLDPKQAHPINPGASDPAARLKDMDQMGIDKAVIFPTLFLEYFYVVENPDTAAAMARAYNDWLLDFCKKAPDRLIPVAVLPQQDINFAIEELQRVAKKGVKAAVIRPYFFQGKFINHPSYDPLWQEIEKLGTVAALHASQGSTNPEWTSEGSFIDRVAANLNIGHFVAESISYRMDNAIALTAFCFTGHMENFPKAKMHYAHSGASWVTLALEKAETYMTLQSNLRDVCLEPEEVFFDRPYLVSFDTWESAVPRQHDTYEKVACWSSRYPHHDASTPEEAISTLEKWGVPSDVVKKWMGGNATEIYGLAAPVGAG